MEDELTLIEEDGITAYDDVDVPATETETLTTVETIDYNARFDEVNQLNITIIFCIGVLSGLVFGKTLWEKVRL